MMEGLLSSLQDIYSNKIDHDSRVASPSLVFSVPFVDGSFGILGGGTPLPFWVQMATVSWCYT